MTIEELEQYIILKTLGGKQLFRGKEISESSIDLSSVIKSLKELILSAQNIQADLSFNADNRGLESKEPGAQCRIESVRIRGLLKSLEELEKI